MTCCDVSVLLQQSANASEGGTNARLGAQDSVPVGTPIARTTIAIMCDGDDAIDSGAAVSLLHASVAAPDAGSAGGSGGGVGSSNDSGGTDPLLQLQLAPAGKVGEIWIAGPGLAVGYLEDEARTEARFVDLPAAELLPLLSDASSSGAAVQHSGGSTGAAGGCGGGGADARQLLLGAGAADWLRVQLQSPNCGCGELPGSFGGNAVDPGIAAQGSSGSGSVRFFRTGDMGQLDKRSGLLCLVGRLDLQVKIRGGQSRPICA